MIIFAEALDFRRLLSAAYADAMLMLRHAAMRDTYADMMAPRRAICRHACAIAAISLICHAATLRLTLLSRYAMLFAMLRRLRAMIAIKDFRCFRAPLLDILRFRFSRVYAVAVAAACR